MRSYFHCSTARYSRHASIVIVLVGSACAETAVISFVVMFFGIFGTLGGASWDASAEMLTVAGFSVLTGLAVCFISAFSAKRKTVMNSRYTFLDIQQKSFVISIYDKEFSYAGGKEVYRMLYRVPFSEFVSAEPSRNGKKLIIKGKIYLYGLPSDSLGYHVRGGDIEFDRWWLNSGGYEALTEAQVPSRFGDAARICKVLTDAKRSFDDIPKPAKREFKEADFIRRRSKPRVMPDDLNYSRNWK